MKFENKVVVLTGGVKGIGRCIKETFEKQGAHVCIIDVLDNDYFVGSIGNKEDLICFTNKVIKDYGHVDYIINNAKPIFKGIDSCSYEEFNEALQVGVTGPFMLVKLFDENHELDLEKKVNDFLANYDSQEIIDIKYQVATLYDGRSQIYCYSCMIIIDDEKN